METPKSLANSAKVTFPSSLRSKFLRREAPGSKLLVLCGSTVSSNDSDDDDDVS
jgi:hypothetical protein|eukprot:COSAG06_NODE_4923_length_3856_cov_3.048177_2_plen_54_part_00